MKAKTPTGRLAAPAMAMLGLLLCAAAGEARAQAAPEMTAPPAAPTPAAATPDSPTQASPTQARPAQQRRPRRVVRRPARPPAEQPQPVPPPTLAVPVRPSPDLAPMPNRDLEAPVVRNDNEGRPSFSPSLIQPRDLPGTSGSTLSRDDLARREDKLFREPAAGGTLRLPFSY